MQVPRTLLNDPARVTALRSSGLLGHHRDDALDRLVEVAARLLHAPTALLSVVTADRQVVKSVVGDGATPDPRLSHSLCKEVVAGGEALVVDDLREHPELRDHPAVTELGIVAYAGAPLHDGTGHVLGALCAAGPEPRAWTPIDLTVLRGLATGVTALIEHHRATAGVTPGSARSRRA